MMQQLAGRAVARRHADEVAVEDDGRAVGLALRSTMRAAAAPRMPMLARAGDRLGERIAGVGSARRGRAWHGPCARRRHCSRRSTTAWTSAAGIAQIERHAIGIVIGREHHRLAPGPDAIEADQPLGGRAMHDAGQIVVAEDRRLLQRAGRHDHRFGAQLVEAVGLDDGQPVVGEPAGADGIAQHADIARWRLTCVGQLLRQGDGRIAFALDARIVRDAAQDAAIRR